MINNIDCHAGKIKPNSEANETPSQQAQKEEQSYRLIRNGKLVLQSHHKLLRQNNKEVQETESVLRIMNYYVVAELFVLCNNRKTLEESLVGPTDKVRNNQNRIFGQCT